MGMLLLMAEICAMKTCLLHSQEDAREALAGSQCRPLEELMGPLDASCTKAAVQGGTALAQDSSHVAEHAAPGNKEKSIVPVSTSHAISICDNRSIWPALR